MKAFVVKKYGKTEKLQLTDISEPTVKENEVLVQIHAAGVNLLDSLIRNGDFKIFLPYKPPFVNGHDMAGVVTKIGSGVSRFKVGDEVYARVGNFRIGTFAEHIAVNENDLAIKPKTLSMEEAASIPLVGLTCVRCRASSGAAGLAQPRSSSRIDRPSGVIVNDRCSRGGWPSGVSTAAMSKRPSSTAIAIFISSSAR